MHYKFPYFEDRPHLPIALEYKGQRVRFLPLLDSGADFSVFYKSDALRLGLNWNEGKIVLLNNADGSPFEAREFLLQLSIEDTTFPAIICFIDNTKSHMPLLGRTDIFEKFIICIYEKERYIELTSV